MRNFVFVLVVLSLLMTGGGPARAQGRAEALLYAPDASSFPSIGAFMDVFDGTGYFVSGLKPEAVGVMEDGRPLPVQQLTEMVVPAQIVVAINPGPALGVRDASGTPRIQPVMLALSHWAQSLPADPADDLSLVSISGPVISHANARDWVAGLNSYQPDFRSTTPNLQSLSMAIDLAVTQTQRVGVKRAVLFITPHMDDPNIDSLIQPLIQKAEQNRVRVFVWFVDTDLYTATTSAAAFNILASQTGGVYYSAKDGKPYPDPEAYFASLRRLYALKYNSAVTQGGQHSFSVQVKTPAGIISSAEQPITVDIQPPNPIFVEPTLQIVRRPPEEDPYNDKLLLPTAEQINIIVEFPDGHKRPLVRTALYVDGQVVAENTREPFDKFSWDISAYTISGEHKILVEAVDVLGLSKTSMELPVTLTVIQPPHGFAAFFARYRQYITLTTVGVAGLALLAILFLGRLRLVAARASASSRRLRSDPLTQPITTAEAPVLDKLRRASALPREKVTDAPAYLQRLTADLTPTPVSPIPLVEADITFGADPVQSAHVLDDSSLAPRHARLVRTAEEGYLLTDSGSVAGTWVNFKLVGREGHRLKHGDVVNFGVLVFRFVLKEPPVEPEPRVLREPPSV